jgi:hypothetical protein
MGEGAWRKLTPSSKLKYLEAEKNIREIHLEITKTMSITEPLKRSFDIFVF